MPIANTKNGLIIRENSGIDLRAACLVNTRGATGDNEALTAQELSGWRVARLNICIDAKFTDTTGN
jgi:hypothetical protein